MAVDVFFRNPKLYIRELLEVGYYKMIFDRGYLTKHRMDVDRWIALNLDPSTDYTVWVTGDQGTAELSPGHTMQNPAAVYPTWEYLKDDIDELESMMQTYVGGDRAKCENLNVPADERPVYGQRHVVCTTRLPDVNSLEGKKLWRIMFELQEMYPECTLHIHGLYSFHCCFGNNFKSMDDDPRESARGGTVFFGSGKRVEWSRAREFPLWVKVNGFRPDELSEPRTRCMFNIKSALWAAEYYQENVKFQVNAKPGQQFDPTDPFASIATVGGSPYSGEPQEGDKFACNSCSLANGCKYYREGAVCSIPGSDGEGLQKHFKTRNSDLIIEGLGELMAMNVERAERGIQAEREAEEPSLSPEVTKIINGLFDQGVRLAKLVDPNLTPKPASQTVNVLVTPNGAGHNPQELASRAVAELEAAGYSREEITMELVAARVNGETIPPPRRAITTTAVSLP